MNDVRWCASGSLEAKGRTPGRACASYEAQCARSNEIVAAASLDDVGRHPDCRSGNAGLRRVLIHFRWSRQVHAGWRCAVLFTSSGAGRDQRRTT
ncbi:DUF664 domain-containing protein [Streptomyces sp. H34-S5]|nr:DUF664 domain-containing protein [Streptomyces sp. H34-S5]MCY0944939.1 DUF664 domain-containing protein [Streptomyces sp. H34-AA3]MCZ4082111.1 DUF664 domain-containing protein [Streptomyces sp. H34-S5]